MQQENTRLELGEPPNPQVEEEWQRLVQLQTHKSYSRQVGVCVHTHTPCPVFMYRITKHVLYLKQSTEELLGTLLPDGTYTTAQPRPSAYIPSGTSDLPVPKPYGSHAPFKPTPLGTTARHIRKPDPKPIDI